MNERNELTKTHLTLVICGIVEGYIDADTFANFMDAVKTYVEEHWPELEPDHPSVTLITNELPK